ncbi:helix-turn-helix domain-containing protein [Limnovirga soli]|uniref:Helix-turn-helix domain-containing protein n=1 Tax=Limnovirga soli TaxID=2656915 RepID=A0A8J8JSB3_9BACT|nr:helix-turn-helix domain-containing protein [Limnovirga soli]NNV53885.1 helix-turn-helix domain-containing protein [Limnovirga soli]
MSKLIAQPQSVGEKIRNRRLELRLTQKECAQILGVCEDSIHLWENNHHEPDIQQMPKIISFVGYVPVECDTDSLQGKLKMFRYQQGLSQEKLAQLVGVNESTIYHFESGKHTPFPKTLKKIEKLLSENM